MNIICNKNANDVEENKCRHKPHDADSKTRHSVAAREKCKKLFSRYDLRCDRPVTLVVQVVGIYLIQQLIQVSYIVIILPAMAFQEFTPKSIMLKAVQHVMTDGSYDLHPFR